MLWSGILSTFFFQNLRWRRELWTLSVWNVKTQKTPGDRFDNWNWDNMKDSYKDLTSWPPTSPLITMENGTSSSLPIKKSNGVVEGGSFDQVWEKIILQNQISSFNANLLGFWRRSFFLIKFHTLMQTFSDFGSGRPWGLKQGGEITRAAQVSEQFQFGKKRVHIPVHHLPCNISFFAAQCGHLRRIHSREEVEHLK